MSSCNLGLDAKWERGRQRQTIFVAAQFETIPLQAASSWGTSVPKSLPWAKSKGSRAHRQQCRGKEGICFAPDPSQPEGRSGWRLLV